MEGFIRIPKKMFSDRRYRKLSDGAKLLYGLMVDRTELSAKNGWVDKSGKVFIYFTVGDVVEHFGCSPGKAIKMLKELDHNGACLIYRESKGQGRPNAVYVMSYV